MCPVLPVEHQHVHARVYDLHSYKLGAQSVTADCLLWMKTFQNTIQVLV